LREKPDNTSEQVFRLKLGQPVKFLAKVEGAAVETGGMKLEGQWYHALADDGTTGYIFSNQLQPWNASEEAMPNLRVEAPATDASLSSLFDTTWRPDYFDFMLSSGILDLAAYQPRFGFFADPMRKVLRVERAEFSRVYKYESIERRDDEHDARLTRIYMTEAGRSRRIAGRPRQGAGRRWRGRLRVVPVHKARQGCPGCRRGGRAQAALEACRIHGRGRALRERGQWCPYRDEVDPFHLGGVRRADAGHNSRRSR
ncbi:MAG: hypothetical protein CVV51_11125, partial [Spirochaetae bacterium HGW-Spirochaetae-7]